ncbi:MAG: DNA/RNA non-specific endonuclease [Planctomycetota bacterium]
MNLLSHVMLNDPEVGHELKTRNNSTGLPMAGYNDYDSGVLQEIMAVADGSSPAMEAIGGFGNEEAVVLFEGRPSLLIKNNGFVMPDLAIWRERLGASIGLLERVIPSVCRIELARHPLSAFYPMIGTAWLVAEDVLVTNRHVAVVFGFKEGNRFSFRRHPEGGHIEIRADFVAEFGSRLESEHEVAEILHIEDEADLDMAILKIRTSSAIGQPVVLGAPTDSELVATVGYPGDDPRVPRSRLEPIFDGTYRVKRLAPGMIMGSPGSEILKHDCSTLKGSSGSPVFSLDTGRAVGLHFSGQFGIANSAVNAEQLKRLLSRLNISVPVSWVEPSFRSPDDNENTPSRRDGYQPDFLGTGNSVPLPGSQHHDALQLPAPENGTELTYRHFSVVMHKDRGLALCAAVNVNGESLRRIPRDNSWSTDSRIGADKQHDNALYSDNDLDRGHLVRRLDPVWGDFDTASEANEDTFFYTNAAPQHKSLNRQLWLGLEDYVLDNARTNDLRISVFTGPVFDPADPVHRGVKIPRRFWKIVAFTDEASGELRSTGYLLDQSHLVIDVPEEAAFGAYKTFQVSVDTIARMTSLEMGELVAADVLANFESAQNLPLTSLEEIVLDRGDCKSTDSGSMGSGGLPRKSHGQISLQELNRMMTDVDIPESALRRYLKTDPAQSRAFHPHVTMDEATVEVPDEESAAAMTAFNGMSRWRRKVRYRRKIRAGWDGLRVVSEGDSWFQYPVMLDDVIDHLFDDYAILSLGAAGDLLQDMVRQDEVVDSVREEGADVVLLSGGGNDLLGGGRLQEYLKTFSPANSPEECIKKNRFRTFVDGITDRYKSIFRRLTSSFSELHVFCHGYDYAIPDGGPWLGRPMEELGYENRQLQREIIAVVIDRFHEAMVSATGQFDRVHFVDCRNAVRDSQWYDELHPDDDGYRTVASRFRAHINEHLM